MVISSVARTPQQAEIATTSSPRLKNAATSAATNPTVADITEAVVTSVPVLKKIPGIVIALSTA
jgi:hypothetical protein